MDDTRPQGSQEDKGFDPTGASLSGSPPDRSARPREVFRAERAGPTPRLTVSILTKDSEARLGSLLSTVATIADEIVVGIDDQTTDGTAAIAASLADVVFFFRHAGQLAGARTLVFDYARGDWILVIDDDEGLEETFRDILPELLADPMVTHYWFSRKWIVGDRPLEFLQAPPWYPDWQLRLFRNDRTLVWKPARAHSGYHVMGPGRFEDRASILHFEPLLCSPDAREAKLDRYRRAAPVGQWEWFYTIQPHARRVPAPRPALAGSRAATSGWAKVHPVARDVDRHRLPPWGMKVLRVVMTPATHCGYPVTAEITVSNTGELTWMPNWGLRSASLFFSHHLFDHESKIVSWDCERSLVHTVVPPGGDVTYIHQFRAPSLPGDYFLQWDMVSEGECWFVANAPDDLTTTPLHVAA